MRRRLRILKRMRHSQHLFTSPKNREALDLAMSEVSFGDDPFRADCWRCARLASDRLPQDSLSRLSFRMYICPECGNKRCAKASDHEFNCDKGAEELAEREWQYDIRSKLDAARDRKTVERVLQEALEYLYTDEHVGMSRDMAQGYEMARDLLKQFASEGQEVTRG